MEQTPELEELVLASEIKNYGAPRKDALAAQIKNGKFPRPIRLSERRTAWLKRELVAWQQAKIAERDRKKSKRSKG